MTTNDPDQAPATPTPSPGSPAAPAAYGATSAVPYGSPYGGVPAEPKGLSITSMVLGIVSILLAFVGMGLLTAIAGIIVGHIAQKKERVAGRGFWLTGLIASYVALGIAAAAIVVILAVFGGLFFFAAGDPGFRAY